MRKVLVFSVISFLSFGLSAFAAEPDIRKFHGSGEVTSVDPVYSQVSIDHDAITGFAGGEGEFFVDSPDMLKGIHKGDLVDFEFTDNKGDVKIHKIVKTGVAPPKEEASPLGEAVAGMLHSTGDVVRGVTEPIRPAHEAVGEPVGATVDATADVVKEGPEHKTAF